MKLMTEHCGEEIVVRDVMKTELITATPETSSLEALKTMRDNDIGCLPVIRNEKLVGLITDFDFLTVSVKLFEERCARKPHSPVSSRVNFARHKTVARRDDLRFNPYSGDLK